MKDKYKIIVGIIIGLIIGTAISATIIYADELLLDSSDVVYNNSNSGGNSKTVQGAIDELSDKQIQTNNLSNIYKNGICKVISGTGKKPGDEIQCSTEPFYIISYSDTEITMFAKYSLDSDYDRVRTYYDPSSGMSTETHKRDVSSYLQNSECGKNTNGYDLTCESGYGAYSYYEKYLKYIGLPNVELDTMKASILEAFGCQTVATYNSYYNGYDVSGKCPESVSWLYENSQYIIDVSDSSIPYANLPINKVLMRSYGSYNISIYDPSSNRPLVKIKSQ